MTIGKKIVDAAIESGATLAGIASMEALKGSASHAIYNKIEGSEKIVMAKDDVRLPDDQLITEDETLPGSRLFAWPDTVKSVLVIGLSHPEDRPELDWWDGRGTPGNRVLMDIIRQASRKIETRLKVKTRKLHYYVEKGGIFLKDAAVLAGLGSIGKNNMLITPSHGPRIRLRALFLEKKIPPTGPVDFDPCAGCNAPCRGVCPEHAIDEKDPIFETIDFSGHLPGQDGMYDRRRCNQRMEKDAAESAAKCYGGEPEIKFCRKCEFVCPAGEKPPPIQAPTSP